jgi:hypothetical protein
VKVVSAAGRMADARGGFCDDGGRPAFLRAGDFQAFAILVNTRGAGVIRCS